MRTTIIVVLVWVAVAAVVGTARLPVGSSLLGNVAVTFVLLFAAGGTIVVSTRPRSSAKDLRASHVTHCESEADVAEENDEECDASFDESVVQRWSRRRDDAGAERIEAMLRADFAPRQQVTTLHIPFCPPFAIAPEVAVTPLDGDGVTIQVVRCLPTGARLDIKRPAAHKDIASHWVVAEVLPRTHEETTS